MAKSIKSTGLLGGTFDPVHNGHISIAEQALKAAGLDRVLLIPAARPPHKANRTMARPEHRLAMARLAAEGRRGLEACDIEFTLPGPNYTIRTVDALRARFPGERLVIIIGADTVAELPSWRDAARLIEEVDWAVAARPGSDGGDCSEIEKRLGLKFADKLRRAAIPVTPVDISSTEVRRLVAAGEDIRGMAPEAVEEYIRLHGLYMST
jgi:nicotinate-nucleotide adenylyltransferase